MNAVHLVPGRPTTLWLWMHDAPEKVVRFPIFNAGTPRFIVQDAARHFKRMAHFDCDTGLITLEKPRCA